MCDDESPKCEESLIGGRNIPTRTAAPTRIVILSSLPPPTNLLMVKLIKFKTKWVSVCTCVLDTCGQVLNARESWWLCLNL
nr:hypothetical protein CFP56_00047 [Quercus suber]